MNHTFLKPFYLYWQYTVTRCYARKVRVIPSAIKVDAKISIPNGLKENAFKTTPENLFYEEIQQEYNNPPTVEQMHFLAEERKLAMKKLSKKMYFKTIERRYFRQNQKAEPNLLTWEMKEHLRSLHSADPEMWNLLTLSHAFPMSPEGIKKILKSGRKSLTLEELKKHDLEVVQNWKTLAKDKIGNYALLKKIVNKRISTMCNGTSLPVPTMTPDDAARVFEGLIFSPTDDPIVDGIRGVENFPKRTTTTWRKKRPTFKGIITQFEERRSQNASSLPTGGPGRGVGVGGGDMREKRLSQEHPDTFYPDVIVRSPYVIEVPEEWKKQQHNAMQNFKKRVTLEEYKKLKNLK